MNTFANTPGRHVFPEATALTGGGRKVGRGNKREEPGSFFFFFFFFFFFLLPTTMDAEPRGSLLDVKMEELQAKVKSGGIISRLVLLMTLPPNADKESAGQRQRELLHRASPAGTDVSGLCLVYATGDVLHLAEGPTKVLHAFLRALGAEPAGADAQVLLLQEDVDPGLCPWAARPVNLSGSDLPEGVSVQRAIGEACAGVVGVAQAIGSGAGGLDDLRGRLSGALCCVTMCV
eukprot:TRINITY_DN8886_c0_g2_i3.p3 TRINITY_DN8886_c0_g2~~TRINITY_DN8886_c0_g2_i3.p3  ORF type:complete len:233 (-),score=60.51 TRINITY_DN8886_c0_g2_i3:97-795(-)